MKMKLATPRSIRAGIPACSPVARKNRAAKSSFKLKRVLVPIDFSRSSKKALHYAISLARDYRAGVVLLHVVKPELATDQLLQGRQAELEKIVRQEVRGRVPVTTVVKVGEFVREIIDLAAARVIDLLLISTHARAGYPDLFLGSDAERIVRYAPCPVLVVREQEHEFLGA